MTDNGNSLGLRDRRPLYVQAIDALTNMIETGQLKTGAQLPPEDELAKSLGISRSTLREALGHLESHGLIARRQGIGTFVSIPTGPGFFGGLQRLEPFRDANDKRRKRLISIRVDEDLLDLTKDLARQHDLRYQAVMRCWLEQGLRRAIREGAEDPERCPFP